MRLSIPSEINDYAAFTYSQYVPLRRASGFDELHEQRGYGDLIELICKLTLFWYLGTKSKVCKLDLMSGLGDKDDLGVRIREIWRSINIKASAFHPYSERLNLFVKEEEISKPIDFYVQCFVHLKNDEPHIHVAGCVATFRDCWKNAIRSLVTIPKTDHMGVRIPVNALRPFDDLVQIVDTKF